MPDYQVRVWTYEDALQSGIPYVKEALSVRKWAFAADVIRLYALYTEGGVYLDSDLFVKKDMTPLFQNDFVSAIESWPKVFDPAAVDGNGCRREGFQRVRGLSIQAAFLASPKEHPFVRILLDYYRNRHFIRPNGSYDMDLIAPDHYAFIAESFGFRYIDRTQHLDGITIYSSRYIAGGLELDSPEAYGIHGCCNSWKHDSWIYRLLRLVKRFVLRLFR